LADYIIVHAWTMVTNVTSYDVLIGGGGCSGYGVPFMILFFMCLLTGFPIPIKVLFSTSKFLAIDF